MSKRNFHGASVLGAAHGFVASEDADHSDRLCGTTNFNVLIHVAIVSMSAVTS